jgi:hypothetical protein
MCDECNAFWCLDCVSETARYLLAHPHRIFTSIQPPGAEYLEASMPERVCMSCKTTSSVFHCRGCFQGSTVGSTMLCCSTCFLDYGTLSNLCRKCYALVSKHHDPVHKFVTIEYKLEPGPGLGRFVLQCDICSESFSLLRACQHEHRRFSRPFSANDAEAMTFECWRQCPRSGIRPDTPPAPEASGLLKCSKCLQGVYKSCLVLICSNPLCHLQAEQAKGFIRARITGSAVDVTGTSAEAVRRVQFTYMNLCVNALGCTAETRPKGVRCKLHVISVGKVSREHRWTLRDEAS